MLRNTRTILLLFAASAFDSSKGGMTSAGTQPIPEPDPNSQAFDPNTHPPLSGFNTSTSTGRNEKSYEESIGQEPEAGNQEGQPTGTEPHPQDDAASTELPQTPFGEEPEQFREDNPDVPVQPALD